MVREVFPKTSIEEMAGGLSNRITELDPNTSRLVIAVGDSIR